MGQRGQEISVVIQGDKNQDVPYQRPPAPAAPLTNQRVIYNDPELGELSFPPGTDPAVIRSAVAKLKGGGASDQSAPLPFNRKAGQPDIQMTNPKTGEVLSFPSYFTPDEITAEIDRRNAPQGSASSRFFGALGETINPLNALD